MCDGRLDEAFCLRVGAWCIGLGTDMFDAQFCARCSKRLGFVAGPIVRHDTFYGDAQPFVPGNCRLEESNGTVFVFIGKDIREGNA